MKRRLTILVLVALALIGAAVPALAQQTQVAPKLDRQSAVRALAKARLALLTARSAKSESRRAARTAQAAVNSATDAKGASAATQATLESTRIQSGTAGGSATTSAEDYVQLPGGPSVTVTAPASGLIEVWAQARLSDGGAVALFEDNQLMPGQGENCGPGEEGRALISSFGGEPVTVGTPGTPSFIGCGSLGPPAGVLFQTSPGPHTYELRYASCGCAPEVAFSQRLLRVAPRL